MPSSLARSYSRLLEQSTETGAVPFRGGHQQRTPRPQIPGFDTLKLDAQEERSLERRPVLSDRLPRSAGTAAYNSV